MIMRKEDSPCTLRFMIICHPADESERSDNTNFPSTLHLKSSTGVVWIFPILKHGRLDEGRSVYNEMAGVVFEEDHLCKCTFQQSATPGCQFTLAAWKRAHSVDGRQAFP